MKPTQSVLEFEAEFKSMIEIINDPLQANARKEEVDLAKEFTDKLNHGIFGEYKEEVKAEEDKQQQHSSAVEQPENLLRDIHKH